MVIFRALLVLVSILFVFSVRRILAPFVMAAFISYVLEPIVSILQGSGVPRTRAILLVYLVFLIGILLLGIYFLPGFIKDLRDLSVAIPQYIEKV